MNDGFVNQAGKEAKIKNLTLPAGCTETGVSGLYASTLNGDSRQQPRKSKQRCVYANIRGEGEN